MRVIHKKLVTNQRHHDLLFEGKVQCRRLCSSEEVKSSMESKLRCIDSGGDHCSVDAAVNQRLAVELRSAMRNDDFFGFQVLIDRALVSCGRA